MTVDVSLSVRGNFFARQFGREMDRAYPDGMKDKKPAAHVAPDPASLAPKATAQNMVLHSRTIGVLPIINQFIRRCRLRETLWQFLPVEDRRNRVDTATTILLLVRNVLISREPIYGLGRTGPTTQHHTG